MSKQAFVFLCEGRRLSPNEVASVAEELSRQIQQDVDKIVVVHFNEADIARMCMKQTVSEDKVNEKIQEDLDPIQEALKFIGSTYNNGSMSRTPLEFAFKFKKDLSEAKGRVAFNPSSTLATDRALINAVDILIDCDVNPNYLRKYGVTKAMLDIIRYVAKHEI